MQAWSASNTSHGLEDLSGGGSGFRAYVHKGLAETTLSILCRAGLEEAYSFKLSLLWKNFILFSNKEENFAGYVILGRHFFFFF